MITNFSIKDKFYESKYSGLWALLFHFGFFFALYSSLSFLGFIDKSPNNINLINWDAGWYADIYLNGYSYQEGQHSNVNFFPLFPLIWRITNLSPILISLLNLSFFSAGMILLKKTFNFNSKEFLLFLSIPSLFFCYVPYSEALFFISGSLLLYGLQNDFKYAILGAFLIGLTRSISFSFIPLMIFIHLFGLKKNHRKKNLVQIREMAWIIVTLCFSLLVAQALQYVESGVFFTLFDTQSSWERQLRFPEFFLTTWEGTRLLWLDGLAFFVGLAAIIICSAQSIRRIRSIIPPVSKPVLFSISYVALTTLIVLLISPVDKNGGTTLASLNRYIFASPFFIVFLHMIFKNWEMNPLLLFKFFGLSLITWFLLGGTEYYFSLDKFSLPILKSKLYFLITIFYSFFFFLASRKAYQESIWSGLYVFNLILQIYLFNQFLGGVWVG